MKRTILTFIIGFIHFISLGQSFTIPELIKIHKSTNEQAETLILNKGYEFTETIKNTEMDELIFAYDPIREDVIYSDYSVFILDYHNGDRTISFQTKKKDYLIAKTYCKINGFKLIDSQNEKESIVNIYLNKNWQIELEAFQTKTNGDLKIVSYFIKIKKPDL